MTTIERTVFIEAVPETVTRDGGTAVSYTLEYT